MLPAVAGPFDLQDSRMSGDRASPMFELQVTAMELSPTRRRMSRGLSGDAPGATT